jgi:hypothetical protein
MILTRASMQVQEPVFFAFMTVLVRLLVALQLRF